MKQIFALGITFLFVATIVTPMVVGYDLISKEKGVSVKSSYSFLSPDSTLIFNIGKKNFNHVRVE